MTPVTDQKGAQNIENLWILRMAREAMENIPLQKFYHS